MNAKRVYWLANAANMGSALLGSHGIGQGLAQARAELTKHAVK